MDRLWVTIAVAGAGCGRIGFDTSANAGQCYAETEVCNGRDDDCDQLTDEDCPCTEQTVTLATALYPSRPDLAWTGDGYGAAWIESDGTTPQLRFARLDATGALVSAAVTLPAAMPSAVELVWTGARFLVEWIDVDPGPAVRIKTLAIEKDGTFADPIAIAAPGYDPSLVTIDDYYAVVYSLTDPLRLAITVLDDLGAVTETRILDTNGSLILPRAAASPDQFAAVVLESGFFPSQLWFQAHTHDGAPLVAPKPIGPGAALPHGHALVWTGREYAITWLEDQVGLHFVTVTPDGVVGVERILGSAYQYVDSARDGTDLVVASQVAQNGAVQVGVTRLDAMGNRLAPDRYVGSSLEAVAYPRLTVASGRVGVTWVDSDGPDAGGYVRFAQLCP